MTVYKGYLIIMKRNIRLILLYLGIFFGITLMFQIFTNPAESSGYQAESVRIGVVDEDGGILAESLFDYLGQFHKVTRMEQDTARMQEDLFYRNIEYIVRIPEHFYRDCMEEGIKLKVTKVPGSYTAFYVDQQINSFLNNARTYYAAGFTEAEIAEALGERNAVEVELLDTDGTAGERQAYVFFFQYIPYLFLSVICYVMGNILAAFHKGDLPKRMHASAVSRRRQNLEGLLAAGTMGISLWMIMILAAMLLYGKQMLKSPGFLYYLLNSLMMLLVSLSIAYLVGLFAKGKDLQNLLSGIVNVISLGMCFLCGVFVPLDIMNKGVKKVSQFLPVYWYEVVNEQLSSFGTLTGKGKEMVLQGIGLQFVFVVALVCAALAASKWRNAE